MRAFLSCVALLGMVASFSLGWVMAPRVVVKEFPLESNSVEFISVRDCGIWVSDKARDGTISGFTIEGAQIGICVDGATNLKILDTNIEMVDVGIDVRAGGYITLERNISR